MRRTSRASVSSTAWSPRKARRRLALFFSRLWLFIAWRRRMRPAPVTLKRFFAAEFVFCLGTLRSSHLSSDVPVRREHHDHVAPVLKGRRLDLAEILHVLGEAHEQVATPLGVRLLAAAEHDRHLDLRTRVQEPLHVTLLRLVVVDADLGAEFDLFDLDLRLVLAGGLGLLLLLVLVLAVVHDPTDRRTGVGGHRDEVEVLR